MFKARLGPWGFNKNSKNNDWGAIAKLHKIRKDSGKSATEFLVHGRKRTLAQLRKHVRSKSMTDQHFLQTALDVDIPRYVRCYTPEPDNASSLAAVASEQPGKLWADSQSAFRPFLASHSPLASQAPVLPDTRPVQSTNLPTTPIITKANAITNANLITNVKSPPIQYLVASPLSQQHSSISHVATGLRPTRRRGDEEIPQSPFQPPPIIAKPLAAPCQNIHMHLKRMAEQALVPSGDESQYDVDDFESWVFLTNPLNEVDPGPVANCSQCNRSVFSHLGDPVDDAHLEQLWNATASSCALPNSVITGDHRAAALKWVVRCFSACIYMTRGSADFARQSLLDAEQEVESLLAMDNPLTLTSLNLILSILHVHDQGQTVESIIGSALKVARNVLGQGNPITTTIAWMTAAAGQKLPRPGLDGNALRRVYAELTEQLGNDHPHCITALYNLSWNLIVDGAWEEAEKNLRSLHRTSCSVLGSSHMQSITALTSLSRALGNQNKNSEAIQVMQQAIERSEHTLGPSHPHRLESKRRLALMYEKINDKPRMLELYWDVLRGRVKMMGQRHPYTIGAKVDLVQLLQQVGRWEGDEGAWNRKAIDALFEQQDDFQARHEAF
jgi:hypothetical protein